MKKIYIMHVVVVSILLLPMSRNVLGQNTALQNFTSGNVIYGGSADGEVGTAVAIDEAGNRYVTGYFEATIDFDPGIGTLELSSAGEEDIFIAKYGNDGTLLWAKKFGGTSNDQSSGIAVDENFVYLSGYFGGSITIGSTTLTSAGGWDMLVLKLDRTNGDAIWAKSYGTPGGATDSWNNTEDMAKAIACDNDGNIYLTGVIGSTINGSNGTVCSFDGIDITIAGQLDIFIAKLNQDGLAQWAKGIGKNLNSYGESIWFSGNYIYSGGSFYGTDVDFNRGSTPASLLSSTGFDAFLTKHSLDGDLQWAVKMGGTLNDDAVRSIATDTDENVYTTGGFRGSNVDFGNSATLSSSGIDAFVWKIDPAGETVWANSITGSGNNYGRGIAVNSRKEIVVAGKFENENVSFGNDITLTNKGLSDLFLAKYDPDGNPLMAKSFGEAMAEDATGMVLYNDREIITTGYFVLTTNFDPDELADDVTAKGLTDFFLHSFTPTPLGTGTENDPFLISDLDQLEWIYLHEEHWDKYYKQTANIDASATSYFDEGRGWTPIGNNVTQFTGVYDAQGYSISNLTINRIEVGVDENTGLFGYTNYPAIISNLALVNANIRGDYVTGSIVGKNNYATVKGCYSSGVVAGREIVGGLVGINQDGATIEDSYSNTIVFASDIRAGGICAINSGSSFISSVYSTGAVSTTNDEQGGIVASNSNSTVEYSFWDTETSGLITSDGGEGKTTEEMINPLTYLDAGWDFKDGIGNETWNIGNGRNNGYPYLNWQFPNDKGMQFITFDALVAKTYGDIPFELTATASSGLEITYESSDTNVATIVGSTVTLVGPGSVEITAKQAGNDDFYPAEDVTQLLTVNKAALTITANSESKVYGAADPVFSVSYDGFVFTDDETDLTGALAFDREPGEDVAEYNVTPSGLTSNNYTITFEDGTLEITPATLTITANSESKVYGEADPVFSVSYDGFVLTDDETDLTGVLAIDREPGEDVADYNITPSGLTSNNYTITFEDGTLEITPAALTITANSESKVYGEADPVFSVSYDGFVLTDDETVLTGALAFDREPGEDVAEYNVTPSGLTSNNYTITFEDGTLEITPAALTITANSESKVYGAADPVFSVSYDGFVLTDDETDLTGALAIDREPGEDVADYNITPSGLTSNNYTITFEDGTLEITPATLTITANSESKVYGEADPVFSVSYDGFVLTDDETDLTGALAFDREPGEDVADYNITPSGLTSNNYTITFEDGTLEITPATLTITANSESKVYGAADPVFSVSYDGFVLTDDETVLTGALAFDREPGEDVADYNITPSGLTSNNYTITFEDGTLEITPATLTITANSESKVYGEADPVFSVSYDGFVLTDDETVLTGALAFDREPGEDVAVYNVTPSGLTSNNYTITFEDGTLEITPAALTITANSESKVYGAADPVFSVSYDGFVFTDDETVLTGALAFDREPGEDVAEYNVTPSGLTSNNYTITFEDGTLEITPAALTITANSESKVYGEADPVFSVGYDGFVLTDDETDLTGALAFDREPGEDVADYNITPSGLASNNYTITFEDGTLEITPAALTLTANSNIKSYGVAITYNGTELQSSGLVTGDNILAAIISSDGAPANATVGEYPVLISDATGTGLSNYNITYEQGTLTVEKRMLTITGSFTVADKEYDGTTDAEIETNNLLLETIIGSDDVSLSGVEIAFELAGPGTDIPVVITAAEISGTDKDNYELSLEATPVTTASIIDYTAVEIVEADITNMFPNPARNTVTIEANNTIRGVSLIDLTGKTILILEDEFLNQITFDISGLHEGIYLVKIVTSKGIQIQKLQVEK